MSNNVNNNGATARISIKCHKIYKDNRERLNKRSLPESYFMRKIFDLSAIMALGNLFYTLLGKNVLPSLPITHSYLKTVECCRNMLL